MGDYEDALSDFQKANELLPENKQILAEMNRLKKIRSEYNQKQKNALKKLFTYT